MSLILALIAESVPTPVNIKFESLVDKTSLQDISIQVSRKKRTADFLEEFEREKWKIKPR